MAGILHLAGMLAVSVYYIYLFLHLLTTFHTFIAQLELDHAAALLYSEVMHSQTSSLLPCHPRKD